MDKKEQLKQVLNVLWFALLASNGILIFIGHSFLFKSGAASASETITNVIVALAIIMLAASRLVYMKAKSMSSTIQKTAEFHDKSFTLYIIAWALGESVSIFGLVYGTIGGEAAHQHAYFFFVMAILVHLAQRPKVA